MTYLLHTLRTISWLHPVANWQRLCWVSLAQTSTVAWSLWEIKQLWSGSLSTREVKWTCFPHGLKKVSLTLIIIFFQAVNLPATHSVMSQLHLMSICVEYSVGSSLSLTCQIATDIILHVKLLVTVQRYTYSSPRLHTDCNRVVNQSKVLGRSLRGIPNIIFHL